MAKPFLCIHVDDYQKTSLAPIAELNGLYFCPLMRVTPKGVTEREREGKLDVKRPLLKVSLSISLTLALQLLQHRWALTLGVIVVYTQ